MATEEPEAVSRERIRDKADVRGQSIQARLRLESEEVEKSTLIREWQDTTAEQPSVGSGSIICRLFGSCISLLRSIVKCSKGKDGSHGDYMQLQESLVALILWSEDHNFSTGNLDTQLHDSEDLRELICSLLLSLADLLVNGLLQHIVTSPAERHATLSKYDMMSLMHESRKEVSTVETPVDYTCDNVPNMAATLGTLVDCLISLNPSLEQSAKDDSKDQFGHFAVIEDRPPYLYHAELVESKFPNASRPLLERLGKCNWERYLRLQERREMIKDGENLQNEEIESKSRFTDSALGTSMPAQSESGGSVSTYAETVVSSLAASSHQKLPKLPREGRNGKRFICQVCNRVVAIRYSRDWKKHVFQDLLAYTCIYEGCSTSSISLWEDRHAMTNHLAVEHGLGPEWKSHPCPLCRNHTGEGKELISLHVSRHMEEIALNALPSGYESDSESGDNATATDGSHSTSSQDDHPVSVPGIATSEELSRRRRKELEKFPSVLARFPEVVIKDQPSQVPTIGQPTEHSVSTAPYSSGDPMPDHGHAIMSPDTIVGGAFSSEASVLDKDWTPKHIDGSAALSTNPSFQGSSNNPYTRRIGTSQVPSTYMRHNYPPVNPADQNPPCNTLYVGNLPIATSEDELKTVFSNQPGYKRLCFRTKANGPMCFVEFDDIAFATKALNELYGHPLHNSVKGGIRLSFSKNPLGVRNGRNNSKNIPPLQMTPHNAIPGIRSGLSSWSPAVGKDFHEPEPPYQGLDESTNQPFKDSSNINV